MTTATLTQVAELDEKALSANWRHMTLSTSSAATPPIIIVDGEGCYLIDNEGNRYLDATSQLVCVEVGYSFGEEFAEAAAEQYRAIGYVSNSRTATIPTIRLAAEVASLAPEGLNHVWFTPSGGEGVEAAIKLARQYHVLRGDTERYRVVSRNTAYHGVTLGALGVTGLPDSRSPFEPYLPDHIKVSNTLPVNRPEGETEEEFTSFLLKEMEDAILTAGPETVSMVILEPVQNHGGSLVAPNGYHEGVRDVCDKYGLLLATDETITAFGRMGAWFASERFGIKADIITTAKGLSSSMAAIGAVIVTDKVYNTFASRGANFTHGSTFGGHPAMAAVALRNIEIIKREGLIERVRENEPILRAMLDSLREFDVVADVRGAGYMWGLHMRRTRPDGTALTEGELTKLYGENGIALPMIERGIFTRESTHENEPVLVVAPLLVAGPEEFDIICTAYREVLGAVQEAWLAL